MVPKKKEQEAFERGLRDGANNAPMQAPYRREDLIQIYNRAWYQGRQENEKYEQSHIVDPKTQTRVLSDIGSIRDKLTQKQSEKTAARKAGRVAKLNGESRDANPYQESELRRCWFMGFNG